MDSTNLELLDPCLGASECVGIGNVKDNNGGLRTTVVHRCQAMVSLLASRVPNLKLYGCVIEIDCLR